MPSLAHVLEVHTRLMSDGYFSHALTLLTARANFLSLNEYKDDLLRYVEFPKLPDINRAQGLHQLADNLLAQGHLREAQSKYSEAEELFRHADHKIASTLLSIDRCELDIKIGKDKSDIAETLWRLKDEVQSADHIEGVRKALMLLYEIAFQTKNLAMRAELDEQYQENAKERGKFADWLSQRYQLILQWDAIASVTSHKIESLTAIYEELAPTDCNALKANICRSLVEKHRALGNSDSVQYWNNILTGTEAHTYDYAQYTMGLDSYFERVKQPVFPVLDPEREIAELRGEIEKTVDQLSKPDILPGSRWVGVLKIPNLANHFMNHVSGRGLAQTEHLVQICIESQEEFSKQLSLRERKHLAAVLHGCANRMNILKANLYDTPEGGVGNLDKMNQGCMQQVLQGYETTASLYEEARSPVDVACTRRMAAIVYQQLWVVNQRPANSVQFNLATMNNKSAYTIFKRYGAQDLRRSIAIESAKLLLQGFYSGTNYREMRPAWKLLGFELGFNLMMSLTTRTRINLAVPAWLKWAQDLFFAGPLDEASKYLSEYEMIIDHERQNLSTLNDQASILAKQRLGQRQDNIEALAIGIQVYYELKDAMKLWCWVQRSKARSISDLLGIGLHMPTHIEQQLADNPALNTLRNNERELVSKLKDAASKQPSDQFYLWTKLENHRARMRKHAPLRELLDMAAGATVLPQQLFNLNALHPESARKIWYVDWMVLNGMIWILAISDKRQSFFDTVMTLENAQKWISDNLQPSNGGKCLIDEHEGIKALDQLAPLVAPLLSLSSEGDLLVLCLTEPLHRIPIHTAVIDGYDEQRQPKEHKILIERNPIVYTFSMTTFHQCTTRSIDQVHPMGPAITHGAVLAVYEDTEDGKPLNSSSKERPKVYSLCSDISKSKQWQALLCGHKLDKDNFAAKCNANIVHFSGHFRSSLGNTSQEILQSGLLLGKGDIESIKTSGKSTNNNNDYDSQSELQARIFTVEDIFSRNFKVPASHFTLIACQSASSYTTKGDEPLGFVSGLLCRGANSVLATQWRISSESGRAFISRFYEPFHTDPSRTVDVAVALQKAVRDIRANELDLQAPYNWAGFALYGTWCYRPRDVFVDSHATHDKYPRHTGPSTTQ